MKHIASQEDLISRLSKRSTDRAAITSRPFSIVHHVDQCTPVYMSVYVYVVLYYIYKYVHAYYAISMLT